MIAPRIDRSLVKTPIIAKLGEKLSVTLVITGIPAPQVRWFVGAREITSKNQTESNFSIRQKKPYYGLSIDYVTNELNKGLSALAFNSMGQDFVRIDVKVYKST